MKKGVRFRIYPNKKQKILIDKTFGCCRFIYNQGLSLRHDAYENGEKIGYNQTSKMLTELKTQEEFSFLKEVDAVALQQSLRNLDKSFTNFFAKRGNYPKFKSKHNSYQSYRTTNQSNKVRIVGRKIKLPKVGYVKIKQSMEIGHINNATIEKTPTDKYYVVLNVDFEPEVKFNNGGAVGIDVGIKNFYSDSNGNTVDNPKYLEKSMRKLKREQRSLSRKQKGSNNRNKQRIKVAKIYEKITDQRNDFLQKQSTMLVRENQTICIEDLNIKGMMDNHKLAQAISSVAWGKFMAMLKYKSIWYGNDLIQISAMYPSSQTCFNCGYKNKLVKNLSIRTWICPNCNIRHDRDINAAKNILKIGLSQTV